MNLSFETAENMLETLKLKAKFVDWNNGKRKEYFGIAARKIEGKERLRKEGFIVFDLDDF